MSHFCLVQSAFKVASWQRSCNVHGSIAFVSSSSAGHPDFHVHSGESAIIVPRAVTGLGRRQVAVVAVAKHHTAVATTSCELFTWGSNRDGRLGYAAVDTQPTPRKYGFIPTQCNPLVPLVFRQSSTYACFVLACMFKSSACAFQPVLTTSTADPCESVVKDHTVGSSDVLS